jgi:hypothetical protein
MQPQEVADILRNVNGPLILVKAWLLYRLTGVVTYPGNLGISLVGGWVEN